MRLALLFVAMVIAVVAGVAVFQFSGGGEKPQTEQSQASNPFSNVTTVDVLVAKTGIPAGTILDEAMVDKQPWPSHLVAEGFIIATSEEAKVVGKIARATFQPREPLLASKLSNPGDPSFLAAVLPPGGRAVTLAVDAISGLAGYVLPGDRVDILLTHNIPEELAVKNGAKTAASYLGKPGVTEVLIANVPVLAVNVRPANVKDPNANNTPSSITVQVSEQGPQQIRLAEKIGTLSVSLRSVADRGTEDMPLPTSTPVLTRVTMMEGAGGELIRVVRGTGRQSDTTETQADAARQVSSPEGSNP